MEEYYRKRALEYEQVYHRDNPERKVELDKIAAALQYELKGMDVLEVACGTGYWTEILSHTAKNIIATDAVEEVLDIAKSKSYSCNVRFDKCDAYSISLSGHYFDGGLASFWLSHVPLSRIDSFLEGFHSKLKEEATVFMADNVYAEGVGGKLIRKEGEKDSYKLRELSDGTKHLVLKNYFSKDELVEILIRNSVKTGSIKIFYGKFYWFVSYQIT